MKILLKLDINDEFNEVEVAEKTTMEDIAKNFKDKLKYEVIIGKINNEVYPLNTKVSNGDRVELMDMRTQHANLVYQHGVTLIYVKAIWDVLGNVQVDINNSLNKGLYTEINGGQNPIDEDILKSIDMRMRELVELNLPINQHKVDADEVISFLEKNKMYDKKKMLQERASTSDTTVFELDGYYDFFYDVMVPSTGYIDKFEILKYKNGVLLRYPHQTNPSVIPKYKDEKKLYEAFSETAKWQRLLKIEFVSDLNEKIKAGDMREVIQLSEALHEQKIVEIARDITERNKRIILIAGPSSSGKTTFARRLCIQLKVNGKNPLYLGTDDYFLNREDTPIDENGEKNYENLEAVDIKLFEDNMNRLLIGEEVDLPEFDFISGIKVFGNRITKIDKDQPIVIEGIHALNDQLTSEIDDKEKYKIYISPLTGLNIDRHNRVPTTDERMLRRMVRDYKYRGKDAKGTINDWPKVRAGEEKNIFPYNGMADAFFNSVHIYEVSILKKYAEPLLMEIKKEEPEYGEAKRLLDFLSFFDVFEDDSIVANNSILREFIGGSVFV